jgi:hypothetical protein
MNPRSFTSNPGLIDFAVAENDQVPDLLIPSLAE